MLLIPRLALLGSVVFVGVLGACGRLQEETAPADGGGPVDGGGSASEDGSVVDAGSPQSCPNEPCGQPEVDAGGPETSGGGDAGVIAVHDAGDGGPSDSGASDVSIDQFAPVPYDAAGAVGFGGGCASATCGGKGAPFDVSFAMYPELTTVLGGVSVKLPGYSDPACQSDIVVVVQIAPGAFAAYAGSDTRDCCPLTVQPSARLLDPCHGSKYNLCGAVAQGPASTPLQQLPACASADGGGVEVWAP